MRAIDSGNGVGRDQSIGAPRPRGAWDRHDYIFPKPTFDCKTTRTRVGCVINQLSRVINGVRGIVAEILDVWSATRKLPSRYLPHVHHRVLKVDCSPNKLELAHLYVKSDAPSRGWAISTFAHHVRTPQPFRRLLLDPWSPIASGVSSPVREPPRSFRPLPPAGRGFPAPVH